MSETKTCDNRLGAWGWLGGGRWGFERYLYTLHRITGLSILCYFLMHICVTSLRAFDIYLWEVGQFLHQPVFRIGEYLVFASFVFHAFNGVRLFFVEMGFAVGKPIEPVYPYKTSLGVQRPLFILMMVFAAIWFAAGSFEFLESFAK